MKRNYFQFFAICCMIALPFTLASCGGDDDENTPSKSEQTEYVAEKDPDDTVVLNLPVNGNDQSESSYYTVSGSKYDPNYPLSIKVDGAGNLITYRSSDEFASVGFVSGISKITEVPTTGWANKTAVVAGNGFVIRNKYVAGTYPSYSYYYEYYRLYVVSFNGSIATVKYAKLNVPDTSAQSY